MQFERERRGVAPAVVPGLPVAAAEAAPKGVAQKGTALDPRKAAAQKLGGIPLELGLD